MPEQLPSAVRPPRRVLAMAVALAAVFALLPAEPGVAADVGRVGVIVDLEDPSVAAYRGGVPGYAATSPQATGERRLDPSSERAQRYRARLRERHDAYIRRLRAEVPDAEVTSRYELVLSGIAAVVPADRIDAIRRLPGVRAVHRDEKLRPETDRGPGFIGASAVWAELGGQTDAGEGVIVGVIDTGIWPEHASFADPDPNGEAYSTPPPPLEGTRECDFGSGDPDDPAFTCNDKLIAAYRFMDAWERWEGNPGGFDSARDNDGHGTHTASTAAGNGDVDATVLGNSLAMVTGVAPRAHVIAYKVCGTDPDGSGGCYQSDSVAAVEQSLRDGVHAINFSISGGTNPYSDSVEQAFRDAYEAGIFVSASAGNSGPGEDTVAHRGPWTMTVGAATHDREFTSTVTLDDGSGGTIDLTGASVTEAITTATPVVDAADLGNELCREGEWAAGTFSGEIVACARGETARVSKSAAVEAAGGAGMILYNVPGGLTGTNADLHSIPSVHVDATAGEDLIGFLDTHGSSVTATFPGGSGSLTGAGDVMAAFSSRGGDGQSLGISKPDVTGPGVNILAGYTPAPNHPFHQEGEAFAIISGTSMSSPHVAGAGALLVHLHPDWSPGQVKSALMTTATDAVTDHDGGATTPFDRGTGRVDLTRAGDPGLTFDETAADYVALENELWEANYPSLYHPNAQGTFRVHRTVRDVLGTGGTWTTSVAEPTGVKLEVPPTIDVTAGGETTFEIAVNVRGLPAGTVRHTRLALDDGAGHTVAFPITVVRGSDTVNTTPVAHDQQVFTPTDATPLDLTLEASDADDDLLDHTVVDPPDHGTLSGTAPDLTYTPDPSHPGSDSFTFEVDDGASTSNTATVSIRVGNDDLADALDLGSASSGTVLGTNVGATKETGEPDHAGNAGGASVWFSWTAPYDGTLVVDTIGSTFATLLGVYTGSAVDSLTAVTDGQVTQDTTYHIAVDGEDGATGVVVLNWTNAPDTADLSVGISESADPVEVGDPLTYAVTVTNHGPDPATSVGLDVDLAPEVAYASDDGGCTHNSGEVNCPLPDLTSGSSHTVEITVDTTDRADPATTRATASAEQFDPDTGDNSRNASTTIAELPGAPTDVTASRGDEQATVSWQAPVDDGGSTITSYTVVSSPGSHSETVSGSARSATVTGLTNGTSYTFTVTATNAIGGSTSDPSNAVVPADVPGAPGGVDASAGDAQATVTWSAADPNGSPVTGYTVTSSPGGRSATVSGSARSATVTGLTNGTSYTFTVTATNAVGTGPASDPTGAVVPVGLPGAPGGVGASAGDEKATVTWSAADPNGSTVTGYTVRSSPGGRTVTVGGSKRSATVSGLTNGTSYTFTVTATNAVGTGRASEPSDAVLPGVRFDGDPVTTERVDHGSPVAAAIEMSRARFAADAAGHVVLSRDDVFADSLAGTALTSGAPLLLTAGDALTPSTRDEIRRVLPAGGTVYLLGGVAAISQAVEDRLEADGHTVRRLFGETRVETAVAVADVVRTLHPDQTRVAVARAYSPPTNPTASWADSVTGGAWAAEHGVPVLVTHTELLDGAVAAWLSRDRPTETVLFGGVAALSDQVEDSVPNPRRVWGATREGTAVAISGSLWGVVARGPRDLVVIDGFRTDGWAYGLAAAGYAASQDAPVLMVHPDVVPDPTAAMVSSCDEVQVDLLLIGSRDVIAAERQRELDALDGRDC